MNIKPVLALSAIAMAFTGSATQAKAADHRDVRQAIYFNIDTPWKKGWYHVDLVRFDGTTVGYGHDIELKNTSPYRQQRTITWMRVPTRETYRVKVTFHGFQYGEWFGSQEWLDWWLWTPYDCRGMNVW